MSLHPGRCVSVCTSLAVCLLFIMGMALAEPVWGATFAPNSAAHTQRSSHFVLHTDLPRGEAAERLESMGKMLDRVADYWGRSPRGQIECYVVEDLDEWPEKSLPHPMARLIIDRIGGVTFIDSSGAGRDAKRKVTVLASSQHGAAEHEVVHAYCALVFGVTGPDWYREGIAQVFAYNRDRDTEGGLHCPGDVFADLSSRRLKPICKVVRCHNMSQRLFRSLVKKMDGREDKDAFLSVENWSKGDVRELNRLKKEYAWYWLACYLLYHNPNYQDRFESLGQDYLAHRRDTFDALFGSIMKQLSFEYRFTFHRFEPGYRVDLCYWEWDSTFRRARSGYAPRTRVKAARGYQASGLKVKKGRAYQVQTDGSWKTESSEAAVSAAGRACGRGRLEGVVMKDYRLSEPFDIGAEGSFAAPCSGRLYLRCCDEWTQLDDNQGSIVVTLQREL